MKNVIEELLSSYKFSERRLKRFKQVREKKGWIQKGYYSYFGTFRKTLTQKRIWTKQEREIYLYYCQKHEELCRSNETKELFQMILEELQTRNLIQLERYHNRNNPLFVKLIDKTKKIKRIAIMQSNLDKFRKFIQKNNKLLKKQENFAYLNNQTLTLQTQFVKFNLGNEETIEIKVFINTDFLLNINNEEDQEKGKTENRIKNFIVEDIQGQNNLYKKEKMVVSLRQPLKVMNEYEEQETELINKSRIISFKELISKIDIEDKLNQKKLLSSQKLRQRITYPQKILINFKQATQDIILNDQVDIIEKEEQLKQQKQITKPILPNYTLNEQDVSSPDLKQRFTQITQAVEVTEIDFHQKEKDQDPIIINPQNITFEDQDSCQIIDINQQNQFDLQQYINYQKNDKSQQQYSENKSGQNVSILEQTKQALSNQNYQNVLEQFRILKNIETQNNQEIDKNYNFEKISQFYNENKKIIQNQRIKFFKKQRQIERKKEIQLKKEREQEKIKQLELERVRVRERQRETERIRERQRKTERIREKYRERQRERRRERERQKEREIDIEIEIELEKERIKQKEKDQQDKIKRQQRLEKQIEKKQRRDKLKEKRTQCYKEYDTRNRNKSKNRASRYQPYNYSQKISENQDEFQEQNLDNNNQQDQLYTNQEITGSQLFSISDLQKSKQTVLGQYQKQKEEINLNQNVNPQQYNPQFSQQFPFNIFNCNYKDQSIPSFQVPGVSQPPSSFIGNPYFYHQLMTINQNGQSSLGQNNASYNINKDQYQVEMIYFLKKVPESFDSPYFFQYPPQTFVPIPERSKIENNLR